MCALLRCSLSFQVLPQWNTVGYNDALWPTGKAVFGYVDTVTTRIPFVRGNALPLPASSNLPQLLG